MATTKIWAIKDSLLRVVDYVKNPEKTIPDDLKQVLHYAKNQNKTMLIGDEVVAFVSGINCEKDTAYEEMTATKIMYGKNDRNLAYHGYQSFKPNEVTPDIAHKIGVELAETLWGEKYQIVVTTHLDREHIHNHIVLNSVSFRTGEKFNDNRAAYYEMRRVSDELCEKHQLSVIKNPKGSTPRSIYFAEKNGDPTRYNLMREAIDFATKVSFTREQFFKVMQKKGYVLDFRESLKYPTIRSRFSKKATRIYHLGEDYLPTAIYARISQNRNTSREFYEFMEPKPVQFKKYRLVRNVKTAKKITGIRALYFHYMYLLGYLPKNNPHTALSPEMREECRKLERYSKQIRLIAKQGLNTESDVTAFIENKTAEINTLNTQRNSIYNQLRRCTDLEKEQALCSRRDKISVQIKELRQDKKTAENILKDIPVLKENIKIELQMKSKQLQKTKNMKKDREFKR